MAESLANLQKKGGGGVPSNLFYLSYASPGGAANTWVDFSMPGVVNDPNSTISGTQLDPKFAHLDNGVLVVDMPIPKAYISGYANYGRTSSGTMVYSGVRMLKNGTLISGASALGSSSSTNPIFRRIQTSFAKGDIISVQMRRSAASSNALVWINIVTDD